MSEHEPSPFETVDVDSITGAKEHLFARTRKNIPIVIVLQGEAIGKKHLLQRPEMHLGRSSDSDIVLSDFEISRRHSMILSEPGPGPGDPPRCIVKDLGSKNGTYVNGKKVESAVLQDKDMIAIGSVVLGFYLKDEVEVKFDTELYSMATNDGLTGVHNKFYFQRELAKELQRALRGQTTLAMIMADLDFFKRVNDTYGHLAGDFILRKMGEILLSKVREYDVCARYGGEEFAVILPNSTLNDAVHVAERLRATVESYEFIYNDQTIKMTLSVGVTPLLSKMKTAEDLIEAADKALYQAKAAGRNCVKIYEEPSA